MYMYIYIIYGAYVHMYVPYIVTFYCGETQIIILYKNIRKYSTLKFKLIFLYL